MEDEELVWDMVGDSPIYVSQPRCGVNLSILRYFFASLEEVAPFGLSVSSNSEI